MLHLKQDGNVMHIDHLTILYPYNTVDDVFKYL